MTTYKIVVPKEKNQDFLFALEQDFNYPVETCVMCGSVFIYTLSIKENEDRKQLANLQDDLLR